jgi:toxin FitB
MGSSTVVEAARSGSGRVGASCRSRAPVPRPQNDTWIAACCLTDNLPLATLNTKDFADFAEQDGLTLI